MYSKEHVTISLTDIYWLHMDYTCRNIKTCIPSHIQYSRYIKIFFSIISFLATDNSSLEILIASTYSMSYIYKLCHVVNGWVKIQNLQHANSGCKYRIYNIAYEADTKLVLYIHKLYKAEQYKHTSSQCLRMAKMYDSLLFFFFFGGIATTVYIQLNLFFFLFLFSHM